MGVKEGEMQFSGKNWILSRSLGAGGDVLVDGGRGETLPVKMEPVNIVVSQKLQMNTYLMDPGLPARTQ